MKWIMLILLIGGGVFAYTQFSGGPNSSDQTTPAGTAKLFIKAALENNEAAIRNLSSDSAADRVVRTGEELRATLDPNAFLRWQNMRPEIGEHALSAQIPGKGSMLVIEFSREGENYEIVHAGLAAF